MNLLTRGMKRISVLSLIFFVLIAIVGSQSYAQRTASSWARAAVDGMEQNGVADQRIMGNLRQNISREEFALLTVNLYQKSTCKPLKQPKEEPFHDIASSSYRREIGQAYELGLVKGIGEGKYNPRGTITRQEIAVLLYNTLKILAPNDDFDINDDLIFEDNQEIAYWARPAIVYLYKKDIMKGTGNLRIDPKGNTTREQALTLVYKLAMEKKFIQHLEGMEYAQKVPVLVYHHLLKNEENKQFLNNSAVLSVERFEEQMKMLYDNGYKTITLGQLESFVKGHIRLPKKSVVITFDDGYLSNYLYAYPILKQYGYTAAIFMITEVIPSSPQHFNPDKLNYMSWIEMEKSEDCFEFPAHTHGLHHLNNKNISFLVSQPKEIIEKDLALNRQLLNTTYFAYPYGQYNRTTIGILKQLGYSMAFNTKPGYVKSGDAPYELKRFSISPAVTMEEFKKIVETSK
ncbi:polysaccharide deacetylase family protein [Geosporobacter ferrireducens]|uniref:NodB homology domain-containing protein n=1 Tax=Geosporobacter ferrireducens TaxID=1424294 RepID=A0A1D8GDS8_9FIRM|nr:polysaccharide deacetylase family protein [Geosporobacter ferrireducens]AOT69051.1 hypothetical protein Gferi_05445 [Geosporobacter ferrireducens]MTI56720.1 hypothetical protein [Geosporobacter ferrireducens]